MPPDFAAPLRKKVVAAILRLLAHDDSRAAFQAARELEKAIRYPLGGDSREKWAAEFAGTLDAVLVLVKTRKISKPAGARGDHAVRIRTRASRRWRAGRDC